MSNGTLLNRSGLLALSLLLSPVVAVALPPEYRADEEFLFRLMLGTLDGNENRTLLHDDSHRFTLGLSASQPIAWHERLAANLELWITERGYAGTATSAGVPTDTVTFEAATLAYGLRLQGDAALRPYGLFAAGFQANRLRARTLTTPTTTVQEETMVGCFHLGAGIEWRFGNDLFSIDWRRWYAKGDFAEFGARDLDLGGDYLGIGLGHRW